MLAPEIAVPVEIAPDDSDEGPAYEDRNQEDRTVGEARVDTEEEISFGVAGAVGDECGNSDSEKTGNSGLEESLRKRRQAAIATATPNAAQIAAVRFQMLLTGTKIRIGKDE